MEGINSMIKSACKRCPHISLPLLDARVGIKRALSLGERGRADAKWSDVQRQATALLDAACDGLGGIQSVMTPDRFAQTPPTTGVQAADPATIQGSDGRSQGQVQWAVSYSLLLWRCLKDVGGKSAANKFGLLVHDAGAQDKVWVCTHIHNCTCYFVKCNVIVAGKSGESFPLQMPIDIASMDTASATDIFAAYFGVCTDAEGKMSVPIDMCKVDVGRSLIVSSSQFCCLTDAPAIPFTKRKLGSLALRVGDPVASEADATSEESADLEHDLALIIEEANHVHTTSDDAGLERDLGEDAMPDDALDSSDLSRSSSVLNDDTEFNRRFLQALSGLGGGSSGTDEAGDADLLASTLDESDAHIAWELEQVGAALTSPVNDLNVDAVWAEWVAAAQDGCSVLQQQATALASFRLGCHRLSLVQVNLEAPVEVVHWRDDLAAPGMMGIPLRLDVSNRVIWCTGVYGATKPGDMLRRQWQSYVGATIVHPDLGISRDKARGVLRSELPQAMVRLRAMWQSAFTDAGGVRVHHEGCVVCSRDEAKPTHKCCICLLALHTDCQECLLVATQGRPMPVELPSVVAAFRTRIKTKSVCGLCQRLFGCA